MRLHEVKMSLARKLGNVFYPISEGLMTDLVLASLPPSYNGFVEHVIAVALAWSDGIAIGIVNNMGDGRHRDAC